MALTSGTRLGPYEILSPLGQGGMGEVYRALDPRLNRHIALKVLPQAMAADPERRERFEREAQAVAALNHPNIVTIHSVEHGRLRPAEPPSASERGWGPASTEDDVVHFLTMELVEGKTLAESIPRHGLSVDQILKLAIPLADAISAAHQRGITHRDLKPTNIMVSDDGRVKVLDFGLAKLKEEQAAPAAVTRLPTEHLTGDGRILGTVAYMSPEQAEGKTVDHRSDIFSLGIILYELTTGERPFKGDSNLSVLSSIMKDTPRPVSEVNQAVPRELGRIVRHCLAKDCARRYQTAADLRNELEELKQDLDSGEIGAGSVQPSADATGRRNRWWLATAVAGVAVVIAAIGSYVVIAPERVSEAPVARVEATFTRLTAQPGVEQFPSLSPDGRWIVYNAGEPGSEDIYLQSVGGATPINLTKDSPEADTEPAFSPDGERIAYRSERQGGGIFVMGRTGDSPSRITDSGFNPAWSPDGNEVLYATEDVVGNPFARTSISQLWAVKVATGERRRVSEGDAVQPSWSPLGRRIAYWAVPRGPGQRDIYTIPAAGGEAVAVTSDTALDWNPVWSPDGKHLYFSSNRGGSLNLWRVPIDEQSGKPLGKPEPITTPSQYVGHLSLSADGLRLVYASVVPTSNLQKVAFDPATGATRGEPAWVTRGSRLWNTPQPSPDNEWLAFASAAEQEDLFVSRSDGSGLRQLTNDVANDRRPRWSSDGKRIAFDSTRGGNYNIWTINPDGSGLHQITDHTADLLIAVWAPDGSRIAATELRLSRVFVFEPDKPWKAQTPQELPAPPAGEFFSAYSWSPDGQWLGGVDRAHPGHPRGGVVVYSFQSQTYDRLTDFGNQGAAWLSDSRRLLFSFEGKLFLVDRLSKKFHEVLSVLGESLGEVSLSRDNRTIYFTRGTTEADIWMATLK